jgi:hypothetical protein
MDISAVRQQVHAAIERARRGAAERRARADDAGRAFEQFLAHTAAPLLRQIANVLRAEAFSFHVATPEGAARLVSRHAEDYIDITLDASGDQAQVILHSSRARGRRIIESERAIGELAGMTEEVLLAAVLEDLEPLVDR